MNQFGFRIFPVFLPFRGQFPGGGNIPDGRVKPHIEHFPFSSFNWNFHTPVEVAGNGTRLKPLVDPRLALSVNIYFPVLFMPFQDPFAQPRFILVKREEPVPCFSQHRFVSAEHRFRINQVGGVQRGAAFFALVTVSFFISAVGACSGDVPVGKELPGGFIKILCRHFFDELPGVIEFSEECRCSFMMNRV